jgi:hypothetical protein
MAVFNVSTASHATLTAATVDTVNLSTYGKIVRVLHRGALANPLYVTIGTVAAPTAINGTPDPTVAGNNTIAVIATGDNYVDLQWPPTSAGTTACVKVISAGAEPYSVQVQN